MQEYFNSPKAKESARCYNGKKVRINHLNGEHDNRYDNKVGVVQFCDDMGYLHGTWGGVSIIPEEDDFDIIG